MSVSQKTIQILLQRNKVLLSNNETLNKQKEALIRNNQILHEKCNTLSNDTSTNNNYLDKYNELLYKYNTLTKQISINSELTNHISSNNELLDKFIECITHSTFYEDLSLVTTISLSNPQGNILCKYVYENDIDITTVTIDGIQLNNNNINFRGFNVNKCLYLNIPHLINNNYCNLLRIGDKEISIYHKFNPIINSVVVTRVCNKTVSLAIYGENLFTFSKVYLSYIDSNYNVLITKLTTNSDYTCIRCSYNVDTSLDLCNNHKLYVVNYDFTSKTNRFVVNIPNIQVINNQISQLIQPSDQQRPIIMNTLNLIP